jgi:hypothetical protein
VPADYGFGCDDDEGVLPTGPDPPSNYPEDFIEDAEARTTMLTFRGSEPIAAHDAKHGGCRDDHPGRHLPHHESQEGGQYHDEIRGL